MEEKVKMSKIGKSLSLVAAALLVTMVSLTACAPAKPAEHYKLRIGNIAALSTLPLFVMQEQGFDKKNGLQLEVTPYSSGESIINAIVAGALDMSIAVGSVPALSAVERGIIPDKMLSVAATSFADPQHPGSGVLAGASVTSWQDLKGQQIAVQAKNSLQGAAIKGRLLKEGVSDYTLVEITFPNMGLAVAGGNVAAATMTEPFLTQSLLRKDGKLLDWVIGGPPFERMEYTIVVCSSALYRNNPQAVKAFLRAHLQAIKWIEDNPTDARLILTRQLSLNPEIGQKIKLLRFPVDGRHDPALLESMQPLLVETGLLKAPIPASRLYDETLLNEVLAEKR